MHCLLLLMFALDLLMSAVDRLGSAACLSLHTPHCFRWHAVVCCSLRGYGPVCSSYVLQAPYQAEQC